MVLALGPDAYADRAKFPQGAWCKPGDWIAWPALEAQKVAFGELTLAVLPDDKIMLLGVDPEAALAR